MLDAATSRPVPYDPAFEIEEENEAETARELVETMRSIMETVVRDEGRAVRAVHAKSHGLLTGRLDVLPDLAEPYAQGLFARPGTYGAVLRFSTNPGDVLKDSVSLPRGLALKIVGVEGERLPGSEGESVQDFVMINAPAFTAPNARKFLATLKLLAATTDTPQVLKSALSTALRGAESLVEAAGGKSGTLLSLGGHPATHILGETFHSQAPLLHGRYMGKVSLAPASPELKALTDRPVDITAHPDALRQAVRAFFREHGGSWDLRVQLLTDPASMPLEDSSTVWPEDKSPHVTVARITVEPQDPYDPPRVSGIDEAMSFSPWNGLAEHRPLGSIMRVRKPAYEMSSDLRARTNGCPIHQPKSAADLPA
ncbi:catalase family protein [Aurantimonas sp. Leaf443]|uniref:catalase family protein n=1 Tax=Aurantimonas sp. Leaf443 TaxID=1736378 RepID=UPI0007007220|nr:catalase family protein [Aurantimonas sp. Leaf443]KQT84018.1 catalase [Aurantimonas sp. Leaf443]